MPTNILLLEGKQDERNEHFLNKKINGDDHHVKHAQKVIFNESLTTAVIYNN